jgi:hypothetical protein
MTPSQIAQLIRIVNRIIAGSGYVAWAAPKATSIVLGVPIVRRKGKIIMANYQLANDTVVAFPILAADAAGTLVPAPAGDT